MTDTCACRINTTKVGMTFKGSRNIEKSEMAVKATETVRSRFMITIKLRLAGKDRFDVPEERDKGDQQGR